MKFRKQQKGRYALLVVSQRYIGREYISANRSAFSIADRIPMIMKSKRLCFPLLANTSMEYSYFRYEHFPDYEKPPWLRFAVEPTVEIYPDMEILYSTVLTFMTVHVSENESFRGKESITLGYSVLARVIESTLNVHCS